MKKLLAVVFVFVLLLISVAIRFSPLNAVGAVKLYEDNVCVGNVEGFCYPQDALCRVDKSGSYNDMIRDLQRIGAKIIKTVRADSGDVTVVYAYSERVAGEECETKEGEKYNVMAAYRDGKYCIGTPVLSGSY